MIDVGTSAQSLWICGAAAMDLWRSRAVSAAQPLALRSVVGGNLATCFIM
jgi:hypothetical protein